MPRGSCMCGGTSYEYEGAGMKVICHCQTCRKLTGSAFATALLVPEQNFTTPGGEASPVGTTTHESGMKMQFYGCAKCPSTLYKTAEGFPGVKIVLAGTLDGEEKDNIEGEGKPQAEIWTKYRVPWFKALDGCGQFEEFPPAN